MLLLLLGTIALVSCQNETDIALPEGGLRVTLNHVSTTTYTRATPAQLGEPVADRFNLKVDDAAGVAKYSGKFTDQLIRLVGGKYTVTASYGDNPVLDIDAPYYVGTQSVTVTDGQESSAEIRCTVGNALISVIFGRNEAEKTRFEKFYQSYGVNVKVSELSLNLSSDAKSAYFRAGTHPELEFTGVLKANGEQVRTTMDLSGTVFPQTFQAADHAIVTLTLPDPESAAVIEISKVELEEATMEETIPLSWLPIPQASAEHQYVDGNLVGTNVTFSNSYPGMAWKAVVTDADGTEYRTIQGTGSLSSTYSDNAEGWPYLPAGNYTATYYLVQDGQEPQKTGSRTFTVVNPNLKVTVDGYTSYSKYLEGDVDAANACDAFTIYALSSKVNISPSLLSNSKYTSSLKTSLNGSLLSGDQSGNTFTYNDQTGKTPSFDAYAIVCSATFDKATATDSKDVYITGLPVSFAPPTQGAGWTGHGTIEWNDKDSGRNNVARIRLGQNAWSQPQYVEYGRFAIPVGTKVETPYDVTVNGATVQTTLSLSLGSMVYFEKKSSYMTASPYEGTTTFTTTAQVTSAKANNSYGSAQTKSWIYSLSYKYGK